jgi:hypothetical protein
MANINNAMSRTKNNNARQTKIYLVGKITESKIELSRIRRRCG